MYAERRLLAVFPNERRLEAIGDLQRDMKVCIPAAQQVDLQNLLQAAEQWTAASQDSWQHYAMKAKVIIDEALLNGYKMRERMREGILTLGAVLAVMNVTLFIFISATDSDPLGATGASLVIIGFLFGAIGACLSGLMGLTVQKSVRGEFEIGVATSVRPLIGGTSGLLGAALVAAGVLNFGEAVIPGLAVTAFVLGFSERLVMGTVERLGARAEEKASAAV